MKNFQICALLVASIFFVSSDCFAKKSKKDTKKGGPASVAPKEPGRGLGMQGRFRMRSGMCECFFMVDEDNLRKEIKEEWGKFEELREFGRQTCLKNFEKGNFEKAKKGDGKKAYTRKGESKRGDKRKDYGRKGPRTRGQYSDKDRSEFAKKCEKDRQKHAEEMSKKADKLGLSLKGVEKLRELSNLTPEEKLAINRMENRLITIELKKAGKGVWAKPEDAEKILPVEEPVTEEVAVVSERILPAEPESVEFEAAK